MKPIVEKALRKAILNNWGGVILGSLQEHASIDSIDGVCPTLGTTDFGMPKIIEMEAKVKQIGNLVDDTNIGYKNPIRGRVYSPEGIAPTLDCCGGGGREPKITEQGHRIRKLTEREFFILMGVSETDIDKIQAYRDEKGKPISKTQQYKMAGNSIVVDVLAKIFDNLINNKGKGVTQLTLF